MENPIQETTDLFRFQITEEQEEERVDKCIAALIDSLSRSFIQKMIKEGRVCINGLPVKASYQVKAGDDLSFLLPKAQEPDIEPEDIPLDILYEDSDVLVVNKPKDMVVHPAAGHYSHTLVNAVLYHCRGQLSGINGVLRLMHWLPVRTLVIPAAADTTKAPLSDILALAAENHTTVVRVDAERTVTAGSISVHLYPEPCAGQEDGSMIVLTSIGDYDTLVPGDVDMTAEVKFLSDCAYPSVELLLVGHHGSKKSTSDAWLDAIAPDDAIISVGYNNYGHPTSDTLERLQAHHIPIYRTDQMGDITVHLS